MSDSRVISSNQSGLHQRLEPTVRRHLDSHFRRPFPDYSLREFARADRLVQQHRGPLIVDSYCGVGESTLNIARQYPDALVIGIDKSAHRLAKHDNDHRDADNYRLFQADTDDFWRLALQANWQPARHFLLYPNPWPKAAHLKRRIHGSPLLPTLLALGGTMELRSNWAVYVEEFATALGLAGRTATVEQYQPATAITPF